MILGRETRRWRGARVPRKPVPERRLLHQPDVLGPWQRRVLWEHLQVHAGLRRSQMRDSYVQMKSFYSPLDCRNKEKDIYEIKVRTRLLLAITNLRHKRRTVCQNKSSSQSYRFVFFCFSRMIKIKFVERKRQLFIKSDHWSASWADWLACHCARAQGPCTSY